MRWTTNVEIPYVITKYNFLMEGNGDIKRVFECAY